jgi:hypothetical protein
MQRSKPPHQESAKIPMSRMIVLRRSSEGGDETWILSSVQLGGLVVYLSQQIQLPSAWVDLAIKDRSDRHAKAEANFSSNDSLSAYLL